MRTNWNNLLAVGIFLTTHPLSLLHPAFLLYSTTSSRQLKTEQPLWFLYPKIKCLWRGDCWPVRTWCIIHSYTITSSQPVTVSLSRSLTGLQLISPNTSHTSPRINYLLGCFVQRSSCCDINKNLCFIINHNVANIYLWLQLQRKVNLLELCDFREQQIPIIPSLEFEEINDMIVLTNWKESCEHVSSAGSVKLNWNTFVSKMECDHNERCHCGDWGALWMPVAGTHRCISANRILITIIKIWL